MTSDSGKKWVRQQHYQRREDAPVSKSLPYMVMDSMGAIVRELAFHVLPLGHLGDPVLWHDPR